MSSRSFYSSATPARLREDLRQQDFADFAIIDEFSGLNVLVGLNQPPRKWYTITGIDFGKDHETIAIPGEATHTVDENGTICYHFNVDDAPVSDQAREAFRWWRESLGKPFVPKPEGEE